MGARIAKNRLGLIDPIDVRSIDPTHSSGQNMSQAGSDCTIAEQVPWSDHVTAYDRAHFITYLRLLDGVILGASEDELCRSILDLDPDSAGAKRTLKSHLNRARWMAATGYRDLLPAS
jgi:hypothetical protein